VSGENCGSGEMHGTGEICGSGEIRSSMVEARLLVSFILFRLGTQILGSWD
jgi:hypothetical protein